MNCKYAASDLKAIELAIKEGFRTTTVHFDINESMLGCWKRQWEEVSQCKKTKPFRRYKDTAEDDFSCFSAREEYQDSDQ